MEEGQVNVLVTGSAGFLGRNLVEGLRSARNSLKIDDIFEYDRGSSHSELEDYCVNAGFVFNLAGVNRPDNPEEFYAGNAGFAGMLLGMLRECGNRAPVMLSSSVQASLAGRYGVSDYGKSKLEAEELFFRYHDETGIPVYVYRFPNLAGKYIRPGYNSAVGTFCHNIAHGLPIRVDNPEYVLELLFAEDLIAELLSCMEGHPHRCNYPSEGEEHGGKVWDGLTPEPDENGRWCYCPVTHKAKLGRIAEMLYAFHDGGYAGDDDFSRKLHRMYQSYEA